MSDRRSDSWLVPDVELQAEAESHGTPSCVCRRLVVMAHRPCRERSLPDAGGAEKSCAWTQHPGLPLLLGAGGGRALAKPETSKTGPGRLPGTPSAGAQTRAEDACTAGSQTLLPECPPTRQSLHSERAAGAGVTLSRPVPREGPGHRPQEAARKMGSVAHLSVKRESLRQPQALRHVRRGGLQERTCSQYLAFLRWR